MIIKAFDYPSVGGLDQDTAVFYDESTDTYYAGKATVSIKPQQYALTGVQVIVLYALVRYLNRYLTFTGVWPILICFTFALVVSRLFLSRVAQTEYEVEILQFSRQEELQFFEEQSKKHIGLKMILVILPMCTFLLSFIFLSTAHFLWLFLATLLAWSSFTVLDFFGKTLYRFNQLYKKVRNKDEKNITNR